VRRGRKGGESIRPNNTNFRNHRTASNTKDEGLTSSKLEVSRGSLRKEEVGVTNGDGVIFL